MVAFPQWWSNDKLSQITAESAETVTAGATGATTTQYLFNDKGSLIGATTMSGYYLVPEASHDGGQTWLRSGLAILDERWVEVSITGVVDSTGGVPAAQTTGFTALGTALGQLVTAIPQGSGRQISYRLNVPPGASAAGIRWRLVESLVAPVLSSTSLSDTANIAYLNGNNTFTGNQIISNASFGWMVNAPNGSSPGFELRNAAGVQHWSIRQTTGGAGAQASLRVRNDASARDDITISTAGDVGMGGVTVAGAKLNITGSMRFPGVGAPVADGAGWLWNESGVGVALRAGGSIRMGGGDTVTGLTISAANAVAIPTSLAIGGGTAITKMMVYTPTLSPAIVAANTTAEQTFTVTGLTTADTICAVNKPTAQAGLGIVGMRVSAADTLAITFSNNTGAGITPTASQVYRIVAVRS